MPLAIRPATPNDASLILRFIRELAEYEKLAHEVVATEDDLKRHLFGDSPKAEVFIAEEGAEALGFCLFFHNFSTFLGRPGFYIEDVYVTPAARGKGAGLALMKAVVAAAKERGYGRVEWSALDWNTPAIDFYAKLGARCMSEWSVFRLTQNDFDKVLG
jgi:GNAT superfamily N-acetyltransferase